MYKSKYEKQMQHAKHYLIFSHLYPSNEMQLKYRVVSDTIPCPPEGLMFPADPDSCLCKQTKIELRLICVYTFRNIPSKNNPI